MVRHAAAVVLSLSFLAPATVRAINFRVGSLADAPDASPGDGACATLAAECTLRAAIEEANALRENVSVTLPAGTFELPLGELSSSVSVSVTGAGMDVTVLDALGGGGHFVVQGAGLFLRGLTLRGGRTAISAGSDYHLVELASCALRGNGTAIEHWSGGQAGLLLTDCEVTDSGPARAMYVSGGFLDIERSLIADSRGGAIEYFYYDDPFDMEDEYGGVTITDSELIRNTTTGRGGALSVSMEGTVFDVNVLRSSFRDNRASSGGAVFLETLAPGSVVIAESTFAENSASVDGGAIGMSAFDTSLSVLGSTFDANGAVRGGAMHVNGAYPTLNHCTLSGNMAGTGGSGAIWGTGGVLRSCTVVENAAERGTGGVQSSSRGFRLSNTILALNTSAGSPSDCGGELRSEGYNLVGDVSTCDWLNSQGTDLVGPDPMLGPLADNGGRTLTRDPMVGSPVIDAGNPDWCWDELDQAGRDRYVDGDGDMIARCDIGALEDDGCGEDSDGDRVGDVCDCAPDDPGLFFEPGLVSLRVSSDRGDAVLTWEELGPQAGSTTSYEIASDTLEVLHRDRDVAAPCLAVALSVPEHVDSRPAGEAGFYYLVRATNDCASATGRWGTDSEGVERTPSCP